MKVKENFLVIAIALFVLVVSAPAEVALEVWAEAYNGTANRNDKAKDIVVDSDGNVYVTGTIYNGDNYDYATIKYDTGGTVQWTRVYNGTDDGYDFAEAIAVDPDGNAYVTGYVDNGRSGYDYVTIKYDTDGSHQWRKTYNRIEGRNDYAKDIAVDFYGNSYVTGYSNGDFVTIKYNNVGTVLWTKIYNGIGDDSDFAEAIALDSDNNSYVTGHSFNGDNIDYATIKYNRHGSIMWTATYNGNGNVHDYAVAVVADSSDNTYVTGYSWNGSNNDSVTIKYDWSGTEEWVKVYNGTGDGDDYTGSIAVDSDGNTYVTGNSWNGINYNYVTVKYDANGTEEWVRLYNGTENGDDFAEAIAVDSDGNAYVTGYSWNGRTEYDYDYVTIKYDTDGIIQWTKTYNGSWNSRDEAHAIALDSGGNAYVTGYSNNGNYDYLTIKYSSGDCVIDSMGYSNGETDPDDICGICDASQSATAWSWNGECAEFSIPIALGYNILGHAMDQPKLLWASEIAADIDAQGGAVLEIDVWSSVTGSWRIYDPTFPIDDFIIEPTDGFIVHAAGPSVWEVQGLVMMDEPQFLDSVDGYTLVAVPTDNYVTVSDLIADMNGADCLVDEVSRWDTGTGSWETYDPAFPLYDFTLDRVTGYFIRGEGGCQFELNP